MKYKIINMINGPYDYTLYLDVDTEIRSSIYELFDFLLIYDIGFTHRVKAKWTKHPLFIDYIDFNTIQTVFLLYKKNDKVLNFLNLWKEEMPDENIEFGITDDQSILNKLIEEKNLLNITEINYVFLPNKIYNARPWLWKKVKEDGEWEHIKILHAHNLNDPKLKKLWAKVKHRIKTMKKNA